MKWCKRVGVFASCVSVSRSRAYLFMKDTLDYTLQQLLIHKCVYELFSCVTVCNQIAGMLVLLLKILNKMLIVDVYW